MVVVPDRAGHERLPDLLCPSPVARPHGRAEGERRVVRPAHRISLVVEGLDRDDGAEDLLVHDPGRPRLADQHRGLVEPARQADGRSVSSRDNVRPVLARVGDELLDDGPLALGDERAEIDARIVAVADPQGRGPGHEALDERVVQRAVHVDPLDARADLAAVREGAPERALDGAPEIGVVEHEHRILATELERHGAEPLGGALRDPAPGRGRAGEDDRVDPVMADERLADGRARPLHDPHETGRGARLAEEPLDGGAAVRGQLGRLEDDGVAGGDALSPPG